MKGMIALLAVVFLGVSPALSQQQIDAATKEDVEQLLQLSGSRDRILQMWAGMAQQAATLAGESYQRKHPDASPLEIRKAAQAAGESTQKMISVFPVDELIEAIVPVYQRHLTHSDIRNIVEFYGSPTGQKMLREMPAMMSESMQAATPIIQKHIPDLEAQAEKAAAEAAKESKPAAH